MANILIVDDIPGVRKSIAAGLKRQGHAISEAENGEVAMNMIQKEAPDLVITDMLMPEMDGLDLIERMKQLPTGKCRVLAMSGGGTFVSPSDALLLANAEADAVLEKPFDSVELNRAVETLLNEVRP